MVVNEYCRMINDYPGEDTLILSPQNIGPYGTCKINEAIQQHLFMLNSSLLYVAATRASRRLLFIGEEKAFNISVKKASADIRNTLINYLNESEENKKAETQPRDLTITKEHLNFQI